MKNVEKSSLGKLMPARATLPAPLLRCLLCLPACLLPATLPLASFIFFSGRGCVMLLAARNENVAHM